MNEGFAEEMILEVNALVSLTCLMQTLLKSVEEKFRFWFSCGSIISPLDSFLTLNLTKVNVQLKMPLTPSSKRVFISRSNRHLYLRSTGPLFINNSNTFYENMKLIKDQWRHIYDHPHCVHLRFLLYLKVSNYIWCLH